MALDKRSDLPIDGEHVILAVGDSEATILDDEETRGFLNQHTAKSSLAAKKATQQPKAIGVRREKCVIERVNQPRSYYK